MRVYSGCQIRLKPSSRRYVRSAHFISKHRIGFMYVVVLCNWFIFMQHHTTHVCTYVLMHDVHALHGKNTVTLELRLPLPYFDVLYVP